jgi:hypothetical protein
VILKVAVTLAPGATLPPEAFDESTVHPAGAEMLNLTPDTGAPVVFVNVAVRSWADLGVNVMTRDSRTRCTSYLAATMLACTASVVASDGYPIVIAPSKKVPEEPLPLSPPLPMRMAPCFFIG